MRCFSNASLVIAIASVAVLGACRPTLDGAWQGTLTCPDDSFPVSMLLDEQQDGDLNGTVYLEQLPGVFGAEFIARGDVDDGAYDPEDNEYDFDLQGDDDTPPEFTVTLAIDEADPDEADGDVRQLQDDGTVVQECSVNLNRLSVTDN